jgi:DNA-binding transcriptional regulator YdaS (Cro superfamily)
MRKTPTVHPVAVAAEKAGGQRALAQVLGTAETNVWNWINRPGAQVTARFVPLMVRLTEQQVRHWHLRPRDWHEIWPELIGSPGAPRVKRTQ